MTSTRFTVSTTKVAATIAISALLLASAPAAPAAEVPEFMKEVISSGPPTPKDQMAFTDMYALNDDMFTIYDNANNTFKKNFRAKNNLIMALFSAKGGRLILYRAGQPPLEAPSPPEVYRMAKSVGHCAMATFELVIPYVAEAKADQSWVAPMKVYRVRVQTCMEALDNADLTTEDRELMRDALKQIAAFMDKCLENKTYTYDDVLAYARGIKPDLAKLITLASGTQVRHWWKVLAEWKQLIGKDWDKTFGLSNSIYVARQNNILYTLLVQFFGEEAMNDRLLLLETTDFTASPDTMMDAFMRIISDRNIGECFFKCPRLMDYELLAGGGRHAIEAEAIKHGQKPILPPLVPFNSHQWPFRVDIKSGTGPATMDDIH